MRAIAFASVSLIGIAAGFGCGSSSSGTTPTMGPACNPCDDGGSTIASPSSGHNANPDGVAYPSPPGGYGHNARSGATAGSVIQNFKFRGYVDPTNTAAGLQTISLADYYDPCQKRYKLLHLTVAAVWCAPCNMETDAIVADKAQLDGEKIIILQALDDGPTMGVAATQANLDYWVSVHRPTFPEMLDPGLHNLGGFFDASAIPWNADIDVRTMEILTSGVGAEDPMTDFATPLSEVTPVSGNPNAGKPGYPVAVSCP